MAGSLPSLERLKELFAGEDGAELTLETPVDLVARTYHTIDHTVDYEEGETYSTNYGPLVSTVIGCGFAAFAPPAPPAP